MHYSILFIIHVIYSTFKQDCPVHIKLRANGSGTALQVTSIEFQHNHEVSKVKIYNCYKD